MEIFLIKVLKISIGSTLVEKLKFFKPNSLKGLIQYLKLYAMRGVKYLFLGNGSNVLFDDETYQGTVIKLGKNFSNISLWIKQHFAGTAVFSKKSFTICQKQ